VEVPAGKRIRGTPATLEVTNEGASKGTRYELRRPLAHVGRGPHNDVVIADDSIAELHAKLQRRESSWFVVDMGSTNGTYVAGERVNGERAVGDGAVVRFGRVKLLFRSEPDVADTEGGTRVIVGFKPQDQKRAPAARPIVATREAGASESTEPARGLPALAWLAAAVVIGATLLFVIQDR
jgi:pSer/pThr/pTyr-binding forkhead associated (FHA) protein